MSPLILNMFVHLALDYLKSQRKVMNLPPLLDFVLDHVSYNVSDLKDITLVSPPAKPAPDAT